MQNYACSGGAARRGDLIIGGATLLISDDLKPPYRDGNSQRERGSDEVIKGGMD